MPKGLKFIIVFLIWGIWNSIARIVLNTDSLDVQLFAHFHLQWFLMIIFYLVVILNILGVVAIFKRKKWGIKILYTLFGVLVFQTIIGTILTFMDTDFAKSAMIMSRESRGLSTDNIDIMVHPAMLLSVLLIYVAFYGLLAKYIAGKKSFFVK